MLDDSKNNSSKKIEPVLKLEFLSHGTVEVDDIDASRKFYEEFLRSIDKLELLKHSFVM